MRVKIKQGFNESIQAHPLLDVYASLLARKEGGEQRGAAGATIACRDSKYCLVGPGGEALCAAKYDLIFREPYADYVNYIAMLNGKYGILNSSGQEVVPCVMDCIYERRDPDGFLPLLKGDMWGIYEGSRAYVYPKFDELIIQSEDYLRARIGDRWGWVDIDGNLTDSLLDAYYGSWYDFDK